MVLKNKKYIVLKPSTEEYLNMLYQEYVMEDSSNLDTKAKELKEHLKYVIDYLENQSEIEVIDTYVEELSLEDRVSQLERDVAMLKVQCYRPVQYTYGIRGSYDKSNQSNNQE